MAALSLSTSKLLFKLPDKSGIRSLLLNRLLQQPGDDLGPAFICSVFLSLLSQLFTELGKQIRGLLLACCKGRSASLLRSLLNLGPDSNLLELLVDHFGPPDLRLGVFEGHLEVVHAGPEGAGHLKEHTPLVSSGRHPLCHTEREGSGT